jgi:CBS domain-containing protein
VIHSTIASIIQGRPLASIESSESVHAACLLMCEHNVRAVAVTQDGALIGVLSERDVIQKCVCPGRQTESMQATEAMTGAPKTLTTGDSLAAALEIMSEGHFHHVPILQDGSVVGVLSSDDIPEEYRMLLERFKEMRGG